MRPLKLLEILSKDEFGKIHQESLLAAFSALIALSEKTSFIYSKKTRKSMNSTKNISNT